MAKNIGKIFEAQVQKSVPDYALLYRVPDSPQSFGGGNLRFSRKSPFDYLLWDSHKHILYALELKTVAGKTISFERTKEDKGGEIHYHQIEGLNKWNEYDGIICGIIIEFRAIEKTVFIDIDEMNRLMSIIPKKSFSFCDLDTYEIIYSVIGQKKARTKYTYDIDGFLNQNIVLS